jgi:rod shape-determining protein MreC
MTRRTALGWRDRLAWAVIGLSLALLLAPARLRLALLAPAQLVLHAPLRVVRAAHANQARLGADNARLSRLATELAVENARLRALVRTDTRAPGDSLVLVRAPVIGRDLATFERYLTISRGQRFGVQVGDPVISADGLVGKVIAASEHQALVQTLLAPEARAAVMNLRSRVPGVTRPEPGRLLGITYLPKDADYQVGDTVVTAGLGRVFPRGLLVGAVAGRADQTGLFQPVSVRPFVDFSRLDVVFVVCLPDTAPSAPARNRVWLENVGPEELLPPEGTEDQ